VPVVSFVFKIELHKTKGSFPILAGCRADQTAFRGYSIWSGNEKKRYDQGKENNAQNDRNPEQRALNAAASREDAACIGAGQTSQACTLAL
jgi:hypothetical protein